MLPPLKYSLWLISFVVGFSLSLQAQDRVFKESLTWAKEQIRKIKDPQTSSEKAIVGSPACRFIKGQLPCARKSESPEESKGTINSLNQRNSQGKILVFISLSMPAASLKSLAAETERYQAILILRGLVKNSFRETAETLKDLGLSAQIDPESFDRFSIQAVPIFVWLDSEGKEKARLRGNVTLAFAHQKFQESVL